MAAIQEAISSIRSLNGPTAEHLKTVVERMESGVDESRLEDWVGLVHEIATTGWHGWEAASAYINVAPDLFKARDIDYVLERGRFGHALGLYSFEPARQYFLGLELLSAGGILDKADAVEPGLKKIHSSFSQASNLLSDLTRLSFGIASTSGKDDLDSWFRLTTGAILDSKTSLETLVRLADGLEDNVPWTLVANIGESAPDSVNLYLSVHQILFESVSAEGIAVFSEQILNWAAPDVRYGGDHSGFVAWLRSLSLYVKHSSSDNSAELRKLNRIFESLPHPDIAVRMLNQLAIMGDSRPENLDRWIEEGSRLWGKNVSACQAWFDVESKTSRDYLKRLQGSVDLEDCKGLFQLYAEAMTGLVLHIEAFADDTENTVVHTDGKSVFMPPRVNKYAREEENYFFYKLCLLHQLAFFEFGTLNPEGLLPTTGYSRWFAGFHYPLLARNIFNLLEDARVDWRLMRKYRGLVIPMQQIMQETARKIQTRSCTSQFDEMMRRMLLFSLEGEAELENNHADMDALMDVMDFLKSSPGLESSISLTAIVYQILEPWFAEAIRNGQIKMASSGLLYEAVDWRGRLDAAWASMRLQLAPIEERIEDLLDSGDESLPMASQMDPDKVDIEKLVRGSNQNKEGVYLPDLDLSPEEGDEGCEESRIPEDVLRDLLAKLAIRKRKGDRFYYDEWDCLIQDYRSQWCTLFEIRSMEEDHHFVSETLMEHSLLTRKIRRQLQLLKPGMLRKVKAMEEGEELDMEKVVESRVDRKSGRSPDNKIFIQKIRKERDVSALFLLDMSASTDDRIDKPELADRVIENTADENIRDTEDILDSYYRKLETIEDTGRRIIDIEKQAAVLMAEALEGLGDSYAICGFSGYGREKVDYYVFKDFDEKYGTAAKGRLGGIRPCRSTRMGPAIRHAVRRLMETESRVKALIILSDGYPQDYDYGHDRSDREYGLQDTTRALAEARQKGIQSFCLTVDPSGHDYLRTMCPDNQYMVIQEIDQLPHELSKVYRSLTT